MRLDRLLTLNFFYPMCRILPKRTGLRIPILMYHSISDDPEPNVHPYFRISTPPVLFAQHMKFLCDNGYEVISLSTAVDLQQGKNCYSSCGLLHMSPKVVLTFDDGYRDFYTHAFPIIKKYDFPAIVFLPTEFVGGGILGIREKSHLSWQEIKALKSQGIWFGSHTARHLQLKGLEKDQIELEIKKSKEMLEDKLGFSILSFSYPFSFPQVDKKFKKYIQEELASAGYEHAVTTIIGTTSKFSDPFFLERIPINGGDDLMLLKAKLEGGYNWLNLIQTIYKINKEGELKKLFNRRHSES